MSRTGPLGYPSGSVSPQFSSATKLFYQKGQNSAAMNSFRTSMNTVFPAKQQKLKFTKRSLASSRGFGGSANGSLQRVCSDSCPTLTD
jgi:hypothetical protein